MLATADLLPWLPEPPADARARLKSGDRLDLRRLAMTRLDMTGLGRIAKAVREDPAGVAQALGMQAVKIGLVGSHTLDFIADAVEGTAIRHGFVAGVVRTPFGQVAQEVLDPRSALNASCPDYILIALDAHALALSRPRFDEGEARAAVAAAVEQIANLVRAIREQGRATPVVTTLAAPADPLFGGFDARFAGSPRAMIDAFNARLAPIAGALIVDIAAAAATVGTAQWHDARAWHRAKLPFAVEATPLYADHVCRVIGAARGRARKCLVLDLDNTLWGGVIGDDGVEGIAIGQGTAAGEAHLAIQTLALDLRTRGVVLAVCSKNDEAAARLPFDRHPEMVLKADHFAVFVANWTNKADNLRAIAKQLNIGTDALVFLDDNPAERLQVRRELPEVAVIEAGEDPGDYAGLVARSGWFEAVGFSAEDLARAEQYRANGERLAMAESASDIGAYLTSLDMRMAIRPFDAAGRARIAQLINKSNQYNLTTRRYGEPEVAAIEADPGKYARQIRLTDRFGDNGMISVVIWDRGPDVWTCDTWLMSCRVLGRRVEEAALADAAEAARAAGATGLEGVYRPSAKNVIVADHWARLGLTKTGEDADGTTRWRLALADYSPPDLPIELETA